METATALQEVDTRLEALVEQAYQVFGKYRIKRLLDVCTACCIDKEEENRLVTISAAGVSREDLEVYATAAFATQPDCPDEFRHFLPRYLELLKDFEIPGAITETTLVRLKQYQLVEEWPEQEVQLINAFAEALFDKGLLTHPYIPNFLSLDGLLIMFDKGGIDVKPLLQQWQSWPLDTGLLHLKDLLLEGMNQKKGHQLANNFASGQLSNTIKQWLVSNHAVFCNRIEHFIAYSDGEDEDQLNELSWAYEVLMYQFDPVEGT